MQRFPWTTQREAIYANQELMQMGYEDVHVLHGGLDAWKKAGGTLEHKPA